MNPGLWLIMVGTFATTASCNNMSAWRDPTQAQPVRPAPLPYPHGWQIYPITKNAMFTGLSRRDIVYLMCSAKEPTTVHYWVPPEAPRTGKLTLVSGPSAISLHPTLVEEDRATPPPNATREAPLEGLIISATLPRRNPVMPRFLASGELTVIWGSHSLAADARADQLPALRRNCSG
jgi:hypothetical protein